MLELDGREVTVSNPDKVYFPQLGTTKLDLVRYYLSVADGALRGVADRPMNLKRFPNGAAGEPFFVVDAAVFTMDSVPERLARLGDPAAEIDTRPGRLDGLLALAERDAANGLQDAPWPPHYPKAAGEPLRAQPSRRRPAV